MRRVRIDFAITIVIACAFWALANFVGEKVIDSMETKSQETTYSDTMIGAAPTEDVPVVSSIAEMMEEEYFTFHIEDSFGSDDSVYYEGIRYDIYPLPSGELVLVDEYYINVEYESNEDEDPYFGWADVHKILPIGRVVHEPLEEGLLKRIDEEGYTLSDISFYVDMRGDFEYFNREECEDKLSYISGLFGVIGFIIGRLIMIASGLFSPIIPLRFMKKWKKYIIYYGILYYGESVNQILAYRKQGRMEEAMEAFSQLTGANMDEAKVAMTYWNAIYEEGILPISYKEE